MQARTFKFWAVLSVFIGIILGPSISSAQSPSPSSPPAADADQEFRLGVEVQVVTVPVTVTKGSGEFVTDLNPGDFSVTDNGAPQQIQQFELAQEPLSMVILIETSSRVEPLLPQVRSTGILFTQLILGESGQAAVLTFDKDVKAVQDFTGNSDQVESAIKNLAVGGSEVRMSDAVARAMDMLRRQPEGRRKVIVIIGEARDNGSNYHPDLVLQAAQQLGITIYTVGLSTLRSIADRPGNQGGAAPNAPFPPGVVAQPIPANQAPIPDTETNWGAANFDALALVKELVTSTKAWLGANPLSAYANGTGGQEYTTDNKQAIEKAISRIGEELRNQYLLAYRPNNLDNPGFHTLRVTVSRANLRVRARPGYVYAHQLSKAPTYAPAGAAPGAAPVAPNDPSLQERIQER